MRRLLLVCVASLLLVACDHPNQNTYGPALDLRGAVAEPPPPPALRPWPLETHEDFDRVEDWFTARASMPDLLDLYAVLAAQRPGDVLLQMRAALAVLRAPAAERSLPQVFKLADRLRKQAPDSPDTRYLVLAVSRAVVLDDRSGAVFVPAGEVEIARRLAADIEAFAKAFPDYRGPHGVTTPDLVAEQGALVRSTAAAEGLAEQAAGAAPKGRVEPLSGPDATFWNHVARFYTDWEELGRTEACEQARAALAVRAEPGLAAVVERRCGTVAGR